jgi:small GTP-binding protein
VVVLITSLVEELQVLITSFIIMNSKQYSISIIKASEVFKCVFIGSENTGKTSIVTRINKGTFDEHLYSTIGVMYMSKNIKLCDHKDHSLCIAYKCYANLDIWDTAGQERFSNMIPLYYREASLIILVFSWNEFEYTWNKVLQLYKEILDTVYDPVILLVGTKNDIATSEQEKEKKIIKKFMVDKSNIIDFVITSSKTGQGIDDIVSIIKKNIINKTIKKKVLENLNIDNDTNKSNCCVVG